MRYQRRGTGMVAIYCSAVEDLRGLLVDSGRHQIRAYGHAKQLRRYRAIVNRG